MLNVLDKINFKKLISIVMLALFVNSCSSKQLNPSDDGANSSSDSSSTVALSAQSVLGNNYSAVLGGVAKVTVSCNDGYNGFPYNNGSPIDVASLKFRVNDPDCILTFPTTTVAYVQNGVDYYGVDGHNIINASNPSRELKFSKTPGGSGGVDLSVYVTTENLYPKATKALAPTLTFKGQVDSGNTISGTGGIVPQVGAGNGFSCALVFPGGLSTGQVYCWGSNAQGIMGTTPNPTSYILKPALVSAPSANGRQPINLAVGEEFACTLNKDHKVFCWGKIGGFSGQPVISASGSSEYVSIATGYKTACALRADDNTVWCWGDMRFNNDAQNTFPYYANIENASGTLVATQISGFTGIITKLSVGANFICAVVDDEDLRSGVQCYGQNRISIAEASTENANRISKAVQGMIGLGNNYTVNTITKLEAYDSNQNAYEPLEDVTSLSSKGLVTCAISSNKPYCWGNVVGGTTEESKGNWWYFYSLLGASSNLSPTPSYLSEFGNLTCLPSVYDQDYELQQCSIGFAYQARPKTGAFSLASASISTGMAAICGVAATNLNAYQCWGVDLTNPGVKQYWGMPWVLSTNVVYGNNIRYSTYDFYIQDANSTPDGYGPTSGLTTGGTHIFNSPIYSMTIGSNHSGSDTKILLDDYGQACAVLIDRSVWCWGGNSYGQVGNNTSNNNVTEPTLILAPTDYLGGDPIKY